MQSAPFSFFFCLKFSLLDAMTERSLMWFWVIQQWKETKQMGMWAPAQSQNFVMWECFDLSSSSWQCAINFIFIELLALWSNQSKNSHIGWLTQMVACSSHHLSLKLFIWCVLCQLIQHNVWSMTEPHLLESQKVIFAFVANLSSATKSNHDDCFKELLLWGNTPCLAL